MGPQIIMRAIEADNEFPDIMRPFQNIVRNILRKTNLSRPPSEHHSEIRVSNKKQKSEPK